MNSYRTRQKLDYLGLAFDTLTIAEVAHWLSVRRPDAGFAYVVTPNVDHMVRLHTDRGLDRPNVIAAYRSAYLHLCDSRILAALARLRGRHLAVVPGSDLTAVVLRNIVKADDTVCLIGGDTRTLEALISLFPKVIFRHHIPPRNLRHNLDAMAAAARFVSEAKARFTLIATGSPQQELIAAMASDIAGTVGVALCIGAAVDFITGKERRAPRWVQKAGFEWAYRLAGNPTRLWRRYIVTGPKIFRIALLDPDRQLD